MANDKKFVARNGLQTQNASMVSPDATNTITVTMLDSDALSFAGDSGQLFSITDSLTGTIFAVNDISGIPSIEVDDDGTVRLAEFTGNLLVGTNVDNATDKVQINGAVLVDTLHSENAVGTDIAGIDLTIAGGQGTGTGIGGSLIFQTALAGTTSSTPNALVTALTINDAAQSLFATGSGAAPSISFSVDPDTGFYSSASTIGIAVSGLTRFNVSTGALNSSNGNGPSIVVAAATNVIPSLVPNRGSTNTGLGGASGTLSLITGGVERMKLGAAGGIHVAEIAAAETNIAAFGQIWVKNDVANTLWFTDDAGTDFQIGGTGLAASPWTSVTNGIDYTAAASAVGIRTTDLQAWSSSYGVLNLGNANAIWGHATAGLLNITANAYYDGSYKYQIADDAARLELRDAGMKVYTAAAGAIDGIITWSTIFQVNSLGNAGINAAPASGTKLRAYEPAGIAVIRAESGAGNHAGFEMLNTNGQWVMWNDTSGNLTFRNPSISTHVSYQADGNTVFAQGSIKLKEEAAAKADTAAYGQIWVKNDVANTLWFTDDAGTDFQIGGTGLSSGAWTTSGTDMYQSVAALTDTYFTDAITDAIPLAHTIHAQGGSGTNIAGAALTIAGGIGTGTGVGGDIIFQTADAGLTGAALNPLVTAITIDSAQNVGFGVVPKAWSSTLSAFQIGGTAAFMSHTSAAASGGLFMFQNAYFDGVYKYINTDEASYYYQQNGTHVFSTAASGTADTAITWTTALTIDNGGHTILPQVNDAVTPTLAFGDGDSGFYEIADDQIGVSIATALKWKFIANNFYGNAAAGPMLANETASTTNPTLIPRSNSSSTGIGGGGADQLSLITAGTEALRVDASQNVAIGNAALATTATDGFLYIPTCAGVPTGVPTTHTGRNPIVYDTTNDDLYVYEAAAWATVGGGGATNPTTYAKCSADTSVNNSTAYVTVTGMSASLAASTTYAVEMLLQLDQGATAADVDVVFLVGAGATGNGIWNINGNTTTDDGIETGFAATTGAVTLTTDVYANNVIRFSGWITTSGAGTANVQFAQNVAVANATTVKQGSWLKVVEL